MTLRGPADHDGPASEPDPEDRYPTPRRLSLRRTRAAIATAAFLVTVVITRTITTSLHYRESDSSGGIVIRGVHVHHLMFGIVLLLVTGYLWLLLVGTGQPAHTWSNRITAAAYGVSAALILDEFALLLNLRDVYWEEQGRQSVGALAVFAALLALGVFVAPVVRAVLRARYEQRRSRRTGDRGDRGG